MEDLIIPLIIIVVVLLNLRKIKKNKKNIQKGATEAQPVKAKGLFAKINEAMEEYAAAAKQAPEDSGEDWPPKGEPEPESASYQKALNEDGEEEWPPRKKALGEEKQALIKKTPVVINIPQKASQPEFTKNTTIVAAAKKQAPGFNQKINPAGLRNAIVWSEILAPPVSLRED